MSLFRSESPLLGRGTLLHELSGYAGNPAGAPVLNFYKPITRHIVDKTVAATDTTGWIYFAPWQCQIIAVRFVCQVVAGSTQTVQLYTVPVASQPENPSSGNAVLASALAVGSGATANTTETGTLSTTAANLLMNAGDLLGYNFSAAPASMVGGVIQVELIQLG